MSKRIRLDEPEKTEEINPNNYFASPKANIEFSTTGCQILDCDLGGGYALGRVVNIVGDKSTAKTGLATEAIANFLQQYLDGIATYKESEGAFDKEYAKAMGMPIERVDFGNEDEPLTTVEDFYRDLDDFLKKRLKDKNPGIYVLDSLDALSDEDEMDRDISKGSYGMAKAKTMSTMFRKLTRKIERSRVLLIIVSQVRDNIGITFGEKYKRSGGKALDFYSSQVLWLAHMKILTKTVNKVKHPIGIKIKAKVKKNKVGLPHRECEFDYLFAYGIDDVGANINWLTEAGKLNHLDLKASQVKDYLKELDLLTNKAFQKERRKIAKAVRTAWSEVETTFLPSRSKYGS